MHDTSWRIRPVDLTAARKLAAELEISPLVAEVLVRRGFADPADAQAFLHPDFRVHSPYGLPGVEAARKRIDAALGKGERIAVYGDYDADGVTATFLLVSVLRALGGDVVWRLPNRFADGYGLSPEAVDAFAADGARVLLTVDCGIGARDEVARATGLGIDVIVTDHHEPLEAVPDCTIVNPKLGDAPFRHWAGVGVALKLAHALFDDGPGADRVELPLKLRPYVDVVAIGTVADVVPLVDENRALVAMGIGRLRSAPRPGLAALLEASDTEPSTLTASQIGFRLAPRINAAGRLDDAAAAVELLEAPDRETALPLAQRLSQLNSERQAIEATMLREALARVPEPVPAGLVLASPDWHEGIVGIVASRVVEQVNRPVVLLSVGDQVAKGSGRSLPSFDILAGVEACASHLLGFGGHKAACGVRLLPGVVPAFADAFAAYAAGVLSPDDLRRFVTVDAVACGADLSLQTADELDLFAPFGIGNPEVRLLLHEARLQSCRLTRDKRHLQCDVRHDGITSRAIRFGFSDIEELRAGAAYDVPVMLQRNSYNGSVSAQVRIAHAEESPAEDDLLCPTACTAACGLRLLGDEYATHLCGLEYPGEGCDVLAGPVLSRLRREARLADHRGRPVLSTLTSLVAAGGRTLVLCASVARRRPLLGHGLRLPQLGGERVYLHGACAPCRLALATGPLPADGVSVVLADVVTAAANPALMAAADRVVFLDPPFDGGLFGAILQAAGPAAGVHFVWGDPEVHFTTQVTVSDLDLRSACRLLYRAVRDADDGGVATGPGGFLAEPVVLAAAHRTLAEVGLLSDDGGTMTARRSDGPVDLDRSDTYRRWRQRSTRTTFLKQSLAMRL